MFVENLIHPKMDTCVTQHKAYEKFKRGHGKYLKSDNEEKQCKGMFFLQNIAVDVMKIDQLWTPATIQHSTWLNKVPVTAYSNLNCY